MRGRGRHSSSQSSATQQQSRMALRKKLAQNVSSDSQQDENTQEDKASTNTESRDELSSLLRSTSLTREKHRTERKNHCRRKEMTEEEEMDLALQLSKQEASNTELRQQQEDENVMKAIQESMVIQTQPGLTSPNKHLLDGVPQSTGSRRKLSYSNGERMPEEGGMNSGAVGPGDEIITRRKKQRKQAGSPLMKMPDLSQTQKVSSQISPSITESFSAHLDSPQSSDSTDIEDFQLQMSPVFPLTGCRAEVHVSRLNLDLVETCKSSGPVFPGDDMGRERQLEQSPTFVKSPVFGRTADCSNHPACENTELSFSSQESSNPTVRSCSPHSPVFHKSHSGQSSLRKDPHRGQVERRDERSTSPTELQRTNLQLRASDCDQSPSGCRKDIKSDGCPTAECNRHSPKSEEVNENCEGWTSGEKELTSDMTLIWSEQEEDDVTPVGSPSPVFPEEKAAVPADNQLGSSPKHILVASQEPSGPDSSLKPQKCLSQLPTSTLQSHPLSRQEEVHRASPQRGEPSDRQTIHYYWGVPFCPRGLDPDTYTKVIVAQMEVYEKSLKEAQRGLLRKAEWGEAIQPEPQKSMSPETSSGSPQPCVSRRRGLRLRGSKRSEAADFLPEERKDDGEEEQQEKKEEGSKESDEVQMDTDDCEVCPETQLSDNNSTKDLNLNVDAETQPLQKNPELPEIEMILRGDSPIRHECQEPEPNLKTDSKMEENVSSCGEDVGGQTAQRGSFPASEIEMHAAYCDGEVAVVDQRRPESQGFQDPLKPRRKRMKTTEVVSEETTQLSDVCRNQEKCYICQKSVLLRDYSRHTELCLQRGTVSRKGNLLSALEKTESRDSGAGPSGSKPQPEAVIDLRDDEDEEVSAYRINNSPIRSFTPISEATGCLIDFRKQQRPKKPSQRRR
uniref:Ubiquitin interaction motif containing 1 n=1 Tax=Poecilia reticulata TaxID=8081 RepID=A0A3P9PWV3_POERE